jgi:hypothetical protein
MDRQARQILDVFNATSDGTPEELKACINRGCPWDQPIPARLCRPFGQPFSPTIPINLAAQYQRHDNLAVLVTKALESGRVDLLESPDLQGRSPAYLAVQKGHPMCLGVMAKAGANLHRAIPHVWCKTVDGHLENPLFDPDATLYPIHHALNQTVLSFTTRTCLSCVKNQAETDLKVCTQCKMAYFCGTNCQKEKWSEHKRVCKKIRQGCDLITFYNEMPKQMIVDKDGFLPFNDEADNDLGLDEGENDIVWEYYDPGTMKWCAYPKSISRELEDIRMLGSPRLLYKPGNDEAFGMEEEELSMNPPEDVATNHAYFCHMIDHHIYSGCGRRMRRMKRSEDGELLLTKVDSDY